MAEQDWLQPEAPVETPGTGWNRRSQAQFELRPLSLGEVLDRTFTLYRSRFWLFAGISMIAAAINVVAQGFSLASAHKLAGHGVFTPAPTPAAAMMNLRAIGMEQASTYLVLLLFFLVSAVTQAGTAFAVTEVYLHRSISVKQALSKVVPRWYRWIGIALWQGWSLAWVPLLSFLVSLALLGVGTRTHTMGLTVLGGVLVFLAFFAGIPAGVVLYLRNALAVPAAVTEGLTIRPAMRRSKMLAAGSKGRSFVVLLIAFCLLEVVGVLQTPAALLMVMAPNKEHYLARAIALLVAFVGHTLVAPIALVGLTLVYFDQRVRKEALDLELLLEGARGNGPPALAGAGTGETARTEGYAPLG